LRLFSFGGYGLARAALAHVVFGAYDSFSRYQPNLTIPNLTFDFGSYDYWRLWILAGTALAVLNFGVCGCRPSKPSAERKAFIRLARPVTLG